MTMASAPGLQTVRAFGIRSTGPLADAAGAAIIGHAVLRITGTGTSVIAAVGLVALTIGVRALAPARAEIALGALLGLVELGQWSGGSPCIVPVRTAGTILLLATTLICLGLAAGRAVVVGRARAGAAILVVLTTAHVALLLDALGRPTDAPVGLTVLGLVVAPVALALHRSQRAALATTAAVTCVGYLMLDAQGWVCQNATALVAAALAAVTLTPVAEAILHRRPATSARRKRLGT